MNKIQIDRFPKQDSKKQSINLLSHEHTDIYIPTSKDVVIYTSDVVAQLLKHNKNVKGVFKYSTLPKTYTLHKTQVYVFATTHCCGSIGFFIPITGHLFLGDGRIDDRIISLVTYITEKYTVKTCVYDNTFDTSKTVDFPSLTQTASALITLGKVVSNNDDNTMEQRLNGVHCKYWTQRNLTSSAIHVYYYY